MAKCGRCGQKVKLIAELKCPKCGHVSGSQNLDTDWDQFDPALGRTRARDADSQTPPSRAHHPRRRYPLKFEE